MQSDHDSVPEHDCCVDMNVVQSMTAYDRNGDQPEGISKVTSKKTSQMRSKGGVRHIWMSGENVLIASPFV